MVDDDPESPSDDPDRAAILARRQRFIAIALSSLASTAACKPQPCLDVAPVTDGKGVGNVDEGGEKADEGGAPPQACLKVAAPDDGGAQPQPCLEVAAPNEGGAQPQPCLDVAPPQDPAPPRPCLKVAAPKEEEAPPRPCLNVRAPPK